jgi:ABC-type transport system involved in multi-copper enzyme maturation permease subunit
MNPLVKKEIRLVAPGWLAVLLLEIVQPWICKNQDTAISIAPLFFFFGLIILSVDSFGREFSLGTFQSMLSQPVERREIWRAKITVLFFAAALIFAAYFASCELRVNLALTDSDSVWHANPNIIENDFGNAMIASGALLFIALTGGLWTALLLRQISTAFWITFLVPVGLLALMGILMSSLFNSPTDLAFYSVFYGAAVLYIASSFWLAHRFFHRAQDVAWTGGVISFRSWRYFEAGSKSSVSTRHRKPVTALLKKEFQLQSVSLFCACALLALHFALIFLRTNYFDYHPNSWIRDVSASFWMMWLILPLTIGCTAVAEERKSGVAECQSCLPVSRRLQFIIKFILVMIFGTLLGGVMPVLLETVASHFGVPSDFFPLEQYSRISITIVAVSAGFTLAAFFASSLSRNFLQALSIAIVTIVGCSLLISTWQKSTQSWAYFANIVTWHMGVWPFLIGIPTVVVMYPWMAYGNFAYYHEGGRLWRRNVKGVLCALLFVFVSSAAIYNRPWEIFEPAEPPHGLAKLSLSNPPRFQNNIQSSGNLLLRMPDGRVWVDSFLPESYSIPGKNLWGQWWFILTRLQMNSNSWQQEFIAGSNWVSATVCRFSFGPPMLPYIYSGYGDTVGVKSDGTLWISSESKPVVWSGDRMMQFGVETNWQQVIRSPNASQILLLKKDGTLWYWDEGAWGVEVEANNNRRITGRPTFRNSMPKQIGTDSDWKEMIGGFPCYARKTDGSVWSFNGQVPIFTQDAVRPQAGMALKNIIARGQSSPYGLTRETNLDQVVFQTFSFNNNAMAYVGKDGTLWVCNRHYIIKDDGKWEGSGFLQVGRETDWLTVTVTWRCVVALKSDGSLWKWNLPQNDTAEVANIPAKRLGIHNDWVGLTTTMGGVVSLAADGSVWLWQGLDGFWGWDGFGGLFLKAPKQPGLVGNVFSAIN